MITKEIFKRTEFYLLIVIVVISTVLSIITDEFLTLGNWFDLLRNNSFIGILALGELVVLISGGIDVSFTATATVAQYIMGIILTRYVGSLFLAFLIPGAVGAALGSINAVIIFLTGVPAVVVTISTLNLFYGLLRYISGGTYIYNLPTSFLNFSQINVVRIPQPDGWPVSLSILVIFWLGVIVITWLVLNQSTIGRKLYAMGSNPEAARRAGFSIFKLMLFAYIYMGLMAGLASVVQAMQVQMIQTNTIVGRELDVLAAVVIGGASVSGGQGSVFGTVLGVLLLAIVRNGLILLGVSSYWHRVATGIIIILAVITIALRRKLNPETAG